MGLPMERASSAIRFSLGKGTIAPEIEHAAKAIGRIVERLSSLKEEKSRTYAVA
jgi:cysteine sulfinate desulfinase/cysteine desulfurase-like protein